jgi:hypothetical protein
MHETRRIIRNREVHLARLRLRASSRLAVLLALLGSLVCALVCVSPARSQSSGGSNGGQGQGQGEMRPYSQRTDVSSLATGDPDSPRDQRRIRALNFERQKQIVSDTDKLLKLARELNEEVAKANTGTLTQDELHKIADIEKLARNVRQRMTESVGEPQITMPPPGPIVFPSPSH